MTHSPPLTRRQREILTIIEDYSRAHGISPTLDEIAHELGVNKVTVFGHVAELERKGILSRAAKGVSRGLQIVAPTTGTSRSVRILGRIAAGAPIETIEMPEELDLHELVPRDRDVYALVVRGNSMIEDSIRDGDIVLVERRTHAENGETVVAVLPGDQATLKRFYREHSRIRLQPANSAMAPILVDEVEIRGVAIGVVRRM
jgi:repressor LexA